MPNKEILQTMHTELVSSTFLYSYSPPPVSEYMSVYMAIPFCFSAIAPCVAQLFKLHLFFLSMFRCQVWPSVTHDP